MCVSDLLFITSTSTCQSTPYSISELSENVLNNYVRDI